MKAKEKYIFKYFFIVAFLIVIGFFLIILQKNEKVIYAYEENTEKRNEIVIL